MLGINFSIYSQQSNADLTSLKNVKEYLMGDWYQSYVLDNKNYSVSKTDKYTFSFSKKKNSFSGSWTREHAHSTAEIIKLVIIKDYVNIELYDIMGDYSYYKIRTLNKNKLVLEDDHGDETIYFREYDQSNQTHLPQ